MNSNFFGEKHGKNGRDQHFSVLSYYLKRAALKELISNTTDIVNIINTSQLSSNFHRRLETKDEIEVKAYLLNPISNQKLIKKTREIKNIKSFYNLQNFKIEDEYFINSTIYTDLSEYVDPLFLDSVVYSEKEITKCVATQNYQFENVNIERNLKQKREAIQIMLRKTSKSPSRTKILKSLIETEKDSKRNLSKKLSLMSNEPSTSKQAEENEKPEYCSLFCKNCTVNPTYTVIQLNAVTNNRRLIGQKKLIDELMKHNHPSSRKINNEFRDTEQSKLELLEHYKYAHNLF